MKTKNEANDICIMFTWLLFFFSLATSHCSSDENGNEQKKMQLECSDDMACIERPNMLEGNGMRQNDQQQRQ